MSPPIRKRLRGELPRSAETDFVALALRLLGIGGEEARRLAVATEIPPAAQGGTA